MNAPAKIERNVKLNIAQRLNAVMAEVDYVQKEKKAGMQYSIVSHDAVTGKVRPIMQAHGVVYYPRNLRVTQNGNRTEAFFTVRFENIDDRSDFIDVETFGYGVDQQDKGPGKAMSYGVKYALLKVLGLETGDDPDAVQDNRADFKPTNNGHQARQAEARDAPFPQGPCKNKTELKAKGRDLWADVMACEDKSSLDALLISHKPLIEQLKEGLPQWWGGGTKDGEPYEGLGQIIERLERDFDGIMETGTDWRGNVMHAG
jgi:hypothetical protein